MNLGAIKQRVYRKFGDEAQVQINDTDIKNWVNDGVRHIVTKNENLLQQIATVDVVVNVGEYVLPGDLYLLRSVTFKYYEYYAHLRNMDMTKFDEYIDGWDGAQNISKPNVYNVYAGKIRFYPIPDKSITAGIKIYYARLPIDVVSDIDLPDVPAEYYNTIVNYVMQQAYELDEDWDASEKKGAQVQTDIQVNRSRQESEAIETYPTISTLREDMWYA